VTRAALTLIGVVLIAGNATAAGDGGPGLVYPTINLILLLAVLVYFGRKPILGFFAERRGKIQDDLQAAADLRRKAEERYAGLQRKLVDLDAELEAIRTAARERAEGERDHIIADANATAERIRSDATAAIDQELRRSRAVLREEAADLAVDLAGNLLREQVSTADRERLVSEFVQRVEASGKGAGTDSGR
jgi:F-type H+-transporting ATPase subunit b